MTSSRASDVRLLPPLPPTLPSSPVLPCPASLGGKLASRDLRALRLPPGVKPLPAQSVASRILLSATSVRLCERLETSACWRHQPATPGVPAPGGVVCGREDREGLQGSGGKAPHQGSWGGSAEAVKILPHIRGEKQRLQRRHRRNWRRTGPTR